MTKRIALGVLSPIRDDALEIAYTFEGDSVDPQKGDGEGHYRGILSSVAPIECLIDLAADEGLPISKLVYLRSQKTKEPGYVAALNRTVSAEQHFREQVFEYYQRAGGRLTGGTQREDDNNFFVPVPYDPADPASSIQGILGALGTGEVLVDVDTTGGPRDAAVLTTIAIQVIKSRFSHLPTGVGSDARVGVGNTVYARANFKTCEGDICRQGDTYNLIDLYHAVESFTKYGKAQELISFFGEGSRAGGTPELVELCQSMGAFSDDLALCNMADVPYHVSQIYKCVRKLRALHERGGHAHRGEVLFLSLLDGLQRDFVEDIGANPKPAQRARQRIAIIRWCVNRQLLQQALSLVREFYPLCMDELGYIGWGTEPLVKAEPGKSMPRGRLYRRRANEERIARVEQISFFRTRNVYVIDYTKLDELVRRMPSRLDKHSSYDRKKLCGVLSPSQVARKAYVTITAGYEDVLPAMLIWYQTLVSIRNESIHANHGSNRGYRQKSARLYEDVIVNVDAVRCEFDRAHTLDSLTHDILKALDALEGKTRLILRRSAGGRP